MGVLIRTLDAMSERRADSVQNFTIKDWLGRIVGPGAPITPTSAMRLTAVFACIRIIAEGVSSLPLVSYRRLPDGGRERDPAFHLSDLLLYQPNDEMEAVTFIETLTAHAAGWGDGYAEVVRDAATRPTALWPLRPDRMNVLREGGRLIYRYISLDGRKVDLTPSQVLHIRGLSFDGLRGYSVLANQQAVELAQAAQDFGTSFFRNNARPGIIAMHPKTLSQGAIDRLSAQFDRMRGPDNANRSVVMEEGLDIKEVGIPPQEAQYLETRRFQLGEIARLFRVPPDMIGDVERSTSWGSGIEVQSRRFIDWALGAWLRRWEQAVRRTLIGEAWRDSHYVEFNRDAALRADTLTRYQAYHLARQDGWMNGDDIAAKENMNKLPDGAGEAYWQPVNMIAAGAPAEEQVSAIRTSLTIPNAEPPMVRQAEGDGQP